MSRIQMTSYLFVYDCNSTIISFVIMVTATKQFDPEAIVHRVTKWV